MLVYQTNTEIIVQLKDNKPVSSPDIIVKGYVDGATVTVDGKTFGSAEIEFDDAAKTLVYQKDNKLMITFKGVSGMTTPDVILDEIDTNQFDVTVGDTNFVVRIVDGKAVTDAAVEEDVPETVVEEEDITEPETDVTETEEE